MIRTLNMNSQSSDVDGKGGEFLVVVSHLASKTTKQILFIILLILLFVGEYAHCPTPPSLPLGLLVIYYYLLFIIYHFLLIIYYLFFGEYGHCPTPPSPPLVIYESRET